jgi:hypothetical protein
MDGSGSGGGRIFGRFTEQAHRVLDLAQEEPERGGHRYLGPSMSCSGCSPRAGAGAAWVLRATGADLGVLEDTQQPADQMKGSRRHRRIIAQVGLLDGYRGAAGPLLRSLGVDLGQLREAVTGQLGRVQR